MAGATVYPKADRTQWFGNKYPGVTMPRVRKVLLHTTETGTWPGYSAGASGPNLTYDPRTRRWRQHFRLNQSARALRDPTGTAVRENRDEVCQVEIICSCDAKFARKHGYLYVEDLTDAALDDLGEFVYFMHREWQVPLEIAPLWLPYPKSYGRSAARMTGPEYDAFAGVLGHQHASGNDHGDPGSLGVGHIIRTARRLAAPKKAEEDEVEIHRANLKKTALKPNAYTRVPEERRPYIFTGWGSMNGIVHLAVKGIPEPGKDIKVRVVEVDRNTGKSHVDQRTIDLPSTQGGDYLACDILLVANWPSSGFVLEVNPGDHKDVSVSGFVSAWYFGFKK